MMTLLDHLCDSLARGQRLALASVIHLQGSAPRGPGSRLLANAEGVLVHGTVGGGLVEARTLAACREALADGQSRFLDVDLSGRLAADADLICGGRVRLLIDPLHPDPATCDRFLRLRAAMEREGALLVTGVGPVAHRSLRAPDGNPLPRLEDNGQIVVEPWLPLPRLILAGGGHVARPTAQIGALAGFAVTVFDDRAEFATRERFPDARQILVKPDFVDCFADLHPDARTFIVILTRGHVHDASVLVQALATPAAYVGMIGSRRKRDEIYARLRSSGMAEAELCRVHCPVGLPIGAQTPEQLAVSIVAECLACAARL